jgi:hypothetical protein
MIINVDEWFELFCKTNNLELPTRPSDNVGLAKMRIMFQQIKEKEHYVERYKNILCYPLQEFSKLKSPIFDFLYERSTGYVMVNIDPMMRHENTCAMIYSALTNTNEEYYKAAEGYCDKFGFFLSSVNYQNTIYIGDNFTLTPQEKLVFKHYTIERM